MKIYDCFTFFNELDVLEVRLEELYPYVDHFVLVESKISVNGKTRDTMYFQENMKRYEKYMDKIIYIYDTDAPQPGPGGWDTENHHRNCIVRGLTNASPEDIILISDLDEIPHPQNFPFLLGDRFKEDMAIGFSHMHHNYFVNIVSPINPCVGTVATKKITLDKVNPQYFRNVKNNIARFALGGWHLSYMGGVEKIWTKFLNSTSPDVNNPEEIPPPEVIKEILKKRLKQGQFNLRHDLDHLVIFVKNPFLPSSLTKEKYPHLFLDNLDSI